MRFSKAAACALLSSAFVFSQPAMANGNLRAEAVIGWDQVAQGINAQTLNVTYPDKVNGVAYGGAIGYDLPVAPILMIGADVEIGGSTGRYNFGDTYFRVGRDLYAGGRVSLRVLPSTRIYAKLGYANGNFTNHQSLLWTRGQVITNDSDSKVSGIRAGIGIQQTIFGPAYVMAEYRYTHYNLAFTRNQVVTGVGVRF